MIIFEEETDNKLNDGIKFEDRLGSGTYVHIFMQHEGHTLSRDRVENLVAKLLDWLGTTK